MGPAEPANNERNAQLARLTLSFNGAVTDSDLTHKMTADGGRIAGLPLHILHFTVTAGDSHMSDP